ncbi:MAG: MOSC domain-containing protein [Gammaproteobacteria bacterium]|nr:MAG: MOSC domain-containing protein [Gammaproteobacteria bacterium]
MSEITLSQLWIHPVKSLRGLSLTEAEVTPRGLAHDRRWMVVDAAGRFLTQRQQPRLALVHPQIDTARNLLCLHDAGQQRNDLELPLRLDSGQPVEVEVWKDRCRALDAGEDAAEWISTAAGQPARLVYMPDETRRAVDPDYARPGDVSSFSDGFPLLIISEGSLDALNRRLGRPLPMRRFRPNLVIAGTAPHAEDEWRRIRIGDVELELVKPCSRCIVTTVDPETGERDPEREPLRTLMQYRLRDNKVYFGQNAIPRTTGRLHTGQPVTVVD